MEPSVQPAVGCRTTYNTPLSRLLSDWSNSLDVRAPAGSDALIYITGLQYFPNQIVRAIEEACRR